MVCMCRMNETNRMRNDPHHKYWWKKLITRIAVEKPRALDRRRRMRRQQQQQQHPQHQPRDYGHDCNVQFFLAITPMAAQVTTPWIFINEIRTKELLNAHAKVWDIIDAIMLQLVDSKGVFTERICDDTQRLYEVFSAYCHMYRFTLVRHIFYIYRYTEIYIIVCSSIRGI